MAGGLIQLAAYGVEDIYLTGDPTVTFFKIVYRRHTNFAVESVVQNFTSQANFGETVNCTISRVGDLIGKIFLYIEIPAIPKFTDLQTGNDSDIKKFSWVNYLGYAIVNEMSIDIGGKMIDKQYGEWMFIWSQVSNRQDDALNKMIGNVKVLTDFSNGKPSYKLYIPLTFWFCKNNGLALPLISLASSDVKLIFTFRKLEECCRIGPTHSIDIIEDIVLFKKRRLHITKINGIIISGYVTDYDYLTKKLYYIKIINPNQTANNFLSLQERISSKNLF